MSKKGSRKKTNACAQGEPYSSRKIYGKERREILERTDIPAAYYKNAVVKRDDHGQLHIYYGGIGAKSYHFHGHMIMNKNGEVRYHRLPFARHGEGDIYSDGKIKRGRKFKRRFCY